MDWKRDLDALIESTMAFVKDVKREPIPDLSAAMTTAEQALADTSKPDLSCAVLPIVRPTSERDEIRQRVSNFKAHQEKMAREREDYYLQVKARMLAPVDPNPALVHPTKNPTVPPPDPLTAIAPRATLRIVARGADKQDRAAA